MEYYIKVLKITKRTFFLEIQLTIGFKSYKALARVSWNNDIPKCEKLIWRGERPSELTEEIEEVIKNECAKEVKETVEQVKEELKLISQE